MWPKHSSFGPSTSFLPSVYLKSIFTSHFTYAPTNIHTKHTHKDTHSPHNGIEDKIRDLLKEMSSSDLAETMCHLRDLGVNCWTKKKLARSNIKTYINPIISSNHFCRTTNSDSPELFWDSAPGDDNLRRHDNPWSLGNDILIRPSVWIILIIASSVTSSLPSLWFSFHRGEMF